MAACTLFTTSAPAQTAKDIRGSSPLIPIENEAPVNLIVDPPRGRLAPGRMQELHQERLKLGIVA